MSGEAAEVSFTRILEGDIANDPGKYAGCAWGDYNNDGYVDLFVANALSTTNGLYHNNGHGSFTRILAGKIGNERGDADAPVTEGAWVTDSGDGVGAAWGDYDHDGFLDLYVANTSGQNNFLFHNNGDGVFEQVTEGSLVHEGGSAWASAWADYDNDGDLDLFVANGAHLPGTNPPPQPGFLYRNDGGTNHWLTLCLVGVASNRSAVGAKVRVLANIHSKSVWQLREISAGGGYCSQDDMRVHFGLGDAASAERVRIEWPSGIVQELRDVSANQFLTVREQQQPLISAPGLTAARSESGFQLTLSGQTNRIYVFEASPNLTRWLRIAVRTNLTGCVRCSDGTSSLQRFYRAVVP